MSGPRIAGRISTMRRLAFVVVALACGPASGQRNVDGFPKAAVAFLDGELPRMEAGCRAAAR